MCDRGWGVVGWDSVSLSAFGACLSCFVPSLLASMLLLSIGFGSSLQASWGQGSRPVIQLYPTSEGWWMLFVTDLDTEICPAPLVCKIIIVFHIKLNLVDCWSHYHSVINIPVVLWNQCGRINTDWHRHNLWVGWVGRPHHFMIHLMARMYLIQKKHHQLTVRVFVLFVC